MMKKLIFGLAVCCGVVSAMDKTKGRDIESSDSNSYQSVSSCSTSESEEWVTKHRELVDSAKINGSAFDELIEALQRDERFYIYDYISSEYWNGEGRFGAFHNDIEFYATFECQQYVD